MVGLVIVSHSATLAAGVEELARGMAGPETPIAVAGGLDLPDRPLGTDIGLIQAAIERVYSDDGVLVLLDVGSALLTAEMAIEALPPERQSHVRICDAPLVEGALAAAVQARLGSALDRVIAEARGALAAKVAHLSGDSPSRSELDYRAATKSVDSIAVLGGPKVTAIHRLTVNNRHGLHARPAAQFVQTIRPFQSDVEVRNLSTGRGPANARSINALMALGVGVGHEIEVIATGRDAAEAIAAIQAIAAANFDEAPDHPSKADDSVGEAKEQTTLQANPASEPSSATLNAAGMPAPPPGRYLSGTPASPGIAIGPARQYRSAVLAIPADRVADPRLEWERLLAAIERTRRAIAATRADAGRRTDGGTASIFEAHLLFLDDEALLAPARQAIFGDHLNAAAAWQRATAEVAASYRDVADEYLRARSADVIEVGQQITRELLGVAVTPVLNRPGVLVAADLSAADVASLDPAVTQAICLANGTSTAHGVILARARGIPVVIGLGEAIRKLAEDTELIVDGDAGQVWPNPDPEQIASYRRQAELARTTAEAARTSSQLPARTQDGHLVRVEANVGSLAEARGALAAGADGVGLLRTEFLFLDRQESPTEDEQYAAYRAVAEALAGRPVVIRTLDVGGDKPIPYLTRPPEANPFLGRRGIRLCLAEPELFKRQLRAIVRVAASQPVAVMFPMVATVAEWRQARALLLKARAEVQGRGEPVPPRIETGMMVEVPAAALLARKFAGEVDFFSIGTNDLTQYTLAAERGNAGVAGLEDALHPAVLGLIQQVVGAARERGKRVTICGEVAADPVAIPILLGLGADDLSVSAPLIPVVKQTIRAVDLAMAQGLVQSALAADSAEAVRELARATGAFNRPLGSKSI